MMYITKKIKLGFFAKQLMVAMGINIISLLVMSTLLYGKFMTDYKNDITEVMSTEITLLAASSRSALLFDNKPAAVTILSSLKHSSSISYVQIYDTNRQLFAEYKRVGQTIDMSFDDFNKEVFFKDQHLYLSKQITINEDNLGTIVMSVELKSLNIYKIRYLLIASIVFLISLILAYLFNSRSQKKLAAPIKDLINLVDYVAKNKRYHKRLNTVRNDEIGDLISGVNAMLNTIETHEMQLTNHANYDELTQLPNRHLFIERLTHAINTAKRSQTSLVVLFLDLDQYKVINDSLGHTIGDELLVQVAAKLTNTLRNSDSISRWGGDEFLILLESIEHTDDIESVVNKIIKELSQPTIIAGHPLQVSTSIGIARFPQDGEDSLSLLKHADLSMFHAKAKGLGQFQYFKPEMLNEATHRLTLEMRVRSALENNDFFMVYQPKIAVDSEEIVGFEALIRWKLDGKFVSPDEFLPIMEELGLMHELSLWILEQTCKQNMSWQQSGLTPVSIAVNLPASFIVHPQCLEKIQSILTTTGLAPKYLEIELTESTFVGSKLNALPALEALVALGINIALDDFGTGYSCMSYLQYLPIKIIKIDGCFIKGLGLSQANKGIVQSIIMLGKSLNMLVVAECVETEQQRSILKDMDCDIIQGYFYSKPLTTDEATRFLTNHR